MADRMRVVGKSLARVDAPGKVSGTAIYAADFALPGMLCGKVLRSTAKGTRLSRAQALKTCFLFLELRHKTEIHQMTGRGVEELLIPEPDKVSSGKEQDGQAAVAASSAGPPKVTPRRRDGRSLPPA